MGGRVEGAGGALLVPLCLTLRVTGRCRSCRGDWGKAQHLSDTHRFGSPQIPALGGGGVGCVTLPHPLGKWRGKRILLTFWALRVEFILGGEEEGEEEGGGGKELINSSIIFIERGCGGEKKAGGEPPRLLRFGVFITALPSL